MRPHTCRLTAFDRNKFSCSHAVHSSPSFDAHESFLLPDHPPGEWQPTVVHRFELTPAVFDPLGKQLNAEAKKQRGLSAGITVSNVEGWHSREVQASAPRAAC